MHLRLTLSERELPFCCSARERGLCVAQTGEDEATSNVPGHLEMPPPSQDGYNTELNRRRMIEILYTKYATVYFTIAF